jgi:hydroxymethylbilane synthase
MSDVLRIGTRGSKLALWQAEWVAGRLAELGQAAEIIVISTRGDENTRQPLGSLSGTGVFTREIQQALRRSQVDAAVHSLKDLPTDPVDGIALAAVPPRESARDAVVSRSRDTLDNLPPGARIGTSSLRRAAQLRYLRSDLEAVDIRGNVDTRLRKLDAGEYDALILAEAGLLRLGWADRISQVLSPEQMLPAPGQGALAIECRSDDELALRALKVLNDEATLCSVTAERNVLAALYAGCSAPVGAWGQVNANGELELLAAVLSHDGKSRWLARDSAAPDKAV